MWTVERHGILQQSYWGEDGKWMGWMGERHGQQVSLDGECGMRGRVVSSGIRQDWDYASGREEHKESVVHENGAGRCNQKEWMAGRGGDCLWIRV